MSTVSVAEMDVIGHTTSSNMQTHEVPVMQKLYQKFHAHSGKHVTQTVMTVNV